MPGLLDNLTTGTQEDGTRFSPVHDLHVGVVTSDMGVSGGALVVGSGAGVGDDGKLVRNNASCSVSPVAQGSKGHADADNKGFLRPDAVLAVIHLSDEDDCSITDQGLPLFDEGSDAAASKLPGGAMNLGLNLRCAFSMTNERDSRAEQAGDVGSQLVTRSDTLSGVDPKVGWFYDDFSESVQAECPQARRQRISFTSDAEPAEGSTLRVECPSSHGAACVAAD